MSPKSTARFDLSRYTIFGDEYPAPPHFVDATIYNQFFESIGGWFAVRAGADTSKLVTGDILLAIPKGSRDELAKVADWLLGAWKMFSGAIGYEQQEDKDGIPHHKIDAESRKGCILLSIRFTDPNSNPLLAKEQLCPLEVCG